MRVARDLQQPLAGRRLAPAGPGKVGNVSGSDISGCVPGERTGPEMAPADSPRHEGCTTREVYLRTGERYCPVQGQRNRDFDGGGGSLALQGPGTRISLPVCDHGGFAAPAVRTRAAYCGPCTHPSKSLVPRSEKCPLLPPVSRLFFGPPPRSGSGTGNTPSLKPDRKMSNSLLPPSRGWED
jgi:hypothetical protein